MREKTFGQLRKAVMRKAGTKDMFEFRQMSPAHNAFWDEMNDVEFERGYVRDEYERPGTPALYNMKLLTNKEYKEWLKKFDEINTIEWIPWTGQIEEEDQSGITLLTVETGEKIRIRHSKGNYRILNGIVEIRIGSIAEWIDIDPLPNCKL